jgi:hypothetical protein
MALISMSPSCQRAWQSHPRQDGIGHFTSGFLENWLRDEDQHIYRDKASDFQGRKTSAIHHYDDDSGPV